MLQVREFWSGSSDRTAIPNSMHETLRANSRRLLIHVQRQRWLQTSRCWHWHLFRGLSWSQSWKAMAQVQAQLDHFAGASTMQPHTLSWVMAGSTLTVTSSTTTALNRTSNTSPLPSICPGLTSWVKHLWVTGQGLGYSSPVIPYLCVDHVESASEICWLSRNAIGNRM